MWRRNPDFGLDAARYLVDAGRFIVVIFNIRRVWRAQGARNGPRVRNRVWAGRR